MCVTPETNWSYAGTTALHPAIIAGKHLQVLDGSYGERIYEVRNRQIGMTFLRPLPPDL